MRKGMRKVFEINKHLQGKKEKKRKYGDCNPDRLLLPDCPHDRSGVPCSTPHEGHECNVCYDKRRGGRYEEGADTRSQNTECDCDKDHRVSFHGRNPFLSKLVNNIELRLPPFNLLWMSAVTFILLFGTGAALRQTPSGIVLHFFSEFLIFLSGVGFLCCIGMLGLYIVFSLRSSRKE